MRKKGKKIRGWATFDTWIVINGSLAAEGCSDLQDQTIAIQPTSYPKKWRKGRKLSITLGRLN